MATDDRSDADRHPHLLVSGWALQRVLSHLRDHGAVDDPPRVHRPNGRLAHVWLHTGDDDERTREAINLLPGDLRPWVYGNDAVEVPSPAMDRSELDALPQDLVGQDAAHPARALTNRSDDPAGTDVTVGVVDTGMWPHPWCAGAYLAHVRDLELENAPYDPKGSRCAGHGTFVTGLILQQAPAAAVRVVRAVDPSGSGRTADVVAAVEQLAAQGVDIINLSLGTARPTIGEASLLSDTIRGLAGRIVVVAAAGNREGESPQLFLPAALPGVLAVGAATQSKGTWDWAPYSNYGPWVDLAAEGGPVVSTFPVFPKDGSTGSDAGRFAGWASWSGTSFATAIVTGQLARAMTSGDARVDAFTAVSRLRDQAEAQTADELRVPVVLARNRFESLPPPKQVAGASG